jgi:uncharacterized membrane protein
MISKSKSSFLAAAERDKKDILCHIEWPITIAVIGILLRIIPIWAMPTWYDENFSILLARLPINRLIAATAGDVHPPLWYLLCWPLAHIPGIPAWAIVRIPSLLASIATLWVWWLILKIVTTNDRIRLVAFGLFCFLPEQIYYAQEGRMYALLTLLVLIAWLCILRRQWVWLAVATTIMLYLQNYGLLYLAALWIAGMIYERKTWKKLTDAMAEEGMIVVPGWKKLTISLTIAGLAFIPWLLVLFKQMGEIHGNYWILYFSFWSVLRDLLYTVFLSGMLKAEMVNIAVFYGVVTWVVIWSIRHRTLSWPTVILAFVPITLAAMISIIWQPIMLYRALIPSGAFICLLIAEPVGTLGRRPLLLMAIFLVPALLVNLIGTEIRSHWADETLLKNGDMYSIIDSQWREGDLLYYADDGVFVSGSVYWKHIDNAIRVTPCGRVYGGLSNLTRAAIGERTGPLPENTTGRTWVVTAVTPLTSPCENNYLLEHGLLDTTPLGCSEDDELVQSCVYLIEEVP